MADPVAVASVEDAAPDWAASGKEVLCPLCDYSLRGLVDPRCPECGYSFTWRDLLEKERQRHPYLFEHQGRRSFLSFRKTLIQGWRPWRFWSDLKATHPINPKRLWLYWVGSALAFVLLGPAVLMAARTFVSNSSRTSGFLSGANWWSDRWPLDIGIASFGFEITDALMLLFGIVLLWPFATFATLMIYQWSMARAKVRRMHVLRTVIYSGDMGVWAGLVILFAFTWRSLALRHIQGGLQQAMQLQGILVELSAVWLAVFIIRLIFAYRNYLRFDHAIATVLCTQIILLLALLLIAVHAFPY